MESMIVKFPNSFGVFARPKQLVLFAFQLHALVEPGALGGHNFFGAGEVDCFGETFCGAVVGCFILGGPAVGLRLEDELGRVLLLLLVLDERDNACVHWLVDIFLRHEDLVVGELLPGIDPLR